jgi:hypothetical protein
MDSITLGTFIAGAIIPFVLSLLKRWFVLTKEQTGLLVLVICFLVASGFELAENNFDWNNYITKITAVYGTSQAIYWAVIKALEIDVKIEGK